MLSPESTATVRATLPAVGAAIGEITRLFYARMFADHPELERNLFNRGNQAAGTQQQALAGAIAGYATLLVQQSEPATGPLLARIAHRHASLGITRDQYRVVHTYLFAAIAEVLGEAVTPEVAAAWDEVYWLMAGELIALEGRLYQEAGVAEGEVWQQAEVLDRRQESRDSVSFTLRPTESAATGFRPGQYLGVAVVLPDGARQIRQYSLSAAPGPGTWRITVKRVHGPAAAGPDGEVSGWLHANLRTGDKVTVSRPFGDLTLEDGDGPLLLASAGIGVTPMAGMLDHLARTGSTRRVIAVHGDRSPADHAHAAELADRIAALPAAELHRWYQEPGTGPGAGHSGQVDLAGLDLPDGLTAYLCGPLPFMRAARTELLRRGVPAAAIRYEVFGPDLWLASA
ncbi:globin domain-containing protein [Kitasatospora sp. MBT63]|uniref:globin domain-containing protein n=1 Tax=Kitasatospora sp. MBT63 TaxID=1444768 RepID=UPI00053971FA|nr:globin domain-containing protein [Kitasatospora sp. MBT63]